MPKLNAEVEFEVYCSTCGSDLSEQTIISHVSHSRTFVEVPACITCINNAVEEAKEEFNNKCPMCDGRGYNLAPDNYADPCKRCQGTGK